MTATSTLAAFAKAEEVYSLFEPATAKPPYPRLKLATSDAPHDFTEPERKAANEWLDGLLKRRCRRVGKILRRCVLRPTLKLTTYRNAEVAASPQIGQMVATTNSAVVA